MNYREVTLLPAKTLSADAVETIDVSMSDPISEIVVQYKALNNGSAPTEHPAKLITKVEIIDGSNVIASLSGFEGEALHQYHFGAPPVAILNYVDNEYCTCGFTIPFGRWLWDTDLALDPKRFKNLQIRLSTDLDGGGSAPDAGILEVVAHAFQDKKPNPIGYLRNFRWYAYSLASSAYETIDLPTDDVIKMIILQSIARTKQPWEQINEIRLSEDSDKQIPIDQNTSDLIKYIFRDVPPFAEHVRAVATTGSVAHYFRSTYEDALIGNPDNGAAAYLTNTQDFGGKVEIKGSAAANVAGIHHGYCPHGAVPLVFGDPWIMEDWYDVRNLKSLRMRLKGGSSILASSTAQLVMQTLHRY